jgi:hypothetical protein
MDPFGQKRPRASLQPRPDAFKSKQMLEPSSQAPADARHVRLALLGMGLCVLAAWLLRQPYAGFTHDSVIYVLLALARLHPTLSNDVFLRFGSQDQFTLFSPLYANAITLLGPERAAALLTFVEHAAFFTCAWLIARQFMSAYCAMLAVALLIVLPGGYGSGTHFHYAEQFLTPRMMAEALVLGALAATLARRYLLAASMAIAAMAVHPLMASGGIALLVVTFVAFGRPKLSIALGCALLVSSLAILVAIAPAGRFDTTWLANVRETSPFLYVSLWSWSDWSRVLLTAAGLGIGVLTGSTALIRRLCAGTLMTIGSGLLISFVYCDLLSVMLFTALQAWRWLWIAGVIFVVLSPVIVRDCWRRGDAGRTAVVLLATAWLLGSANSTSAVAALAAVLCAASPAGWSDHRYVQLLFRGSWLLLVVAALNELAYRLDLPVSVDDPRASIALQKLQIACGDGIVPALALVVLWLAVNRTKSLYLDAAVVLTAALACFSLFWLAGPSWINVSYTQAVYNRFEAWRTAVPPHAEVLWPDTPLGSWYLLERPNYWSIFQMPGAIFSREKALLVARRAELIGGALPSRAHPGSAKLDKSRVHEFNPKISAELTPAGLAYLCSDPDLGYVASWLRLASTPIAPVIPNPTKPQSALYLYPCASFRH